MCCPVNGGLPGARAHLEAAIQAAEALGLPNPVESLNLGMVLRAEHDLGSARSTLEESLRIFRRTGDKRNMACAIRGLACLDGDLGDWHRAAMLHGVAQACSTRPEARGTRSTCAPGRKASTKHAGLSA